MLKMAELYYSAVNQCIYTYMVTNPFKQDEWFINFAILHRNVNSFAIGYHTTISPIDVN